MFAEQKSFLFVVVGVVGIVIAAVEILIILKTVVFFSFFLNFNDSER